MSVTLVSMRTKTLLSALGALGVVLVTSVPAHAQELDGRSRIELRVGTAIPGGTTTTEVGNISVETQSVGALGAIAYSHWVRERVAVTFSIGGWALGVDTRVGSGGVMTRTAVVAPLMAGVRYYFPESSSGSWFRPYASLTAGPVFGTESESSVGTTIVSRSVTRAAFGTRAGAGFDFPFAGSWVFGVFGGYYLMTDFSEPIGSQKNHSSPDLGISISWTWGGSS